MLADSFRALHSGTAWRDMTDRFDPWSTAYQRFRCWRKRNTSIRCSNACILRLNEHALIDDPTLGDPGSAGHNAYRIER
ncbi:hypothetical protein [Pseudomonas chlororaphis]|uniref:hypothetical protein n=1 Tax=Pseudomonas chlororaphis TaxID=587753 RepID=UPI003BF5C62A